MANTSTYAPVKRFNAAGVDILGRNGFFGPGGEVQITYSSLQGGATGASKIIDVALGPAESWSIIDEKRSKIYTYDQYGQLLFVFGDKGKMLGNISRMTAITYQGTNLLVMDGDTKSFTVYTRTEYGDILIRALQNEIDRNYDAAVDDYQSILQRNSNFDAAYIGIGNAMFRSGSFEEALDYYKSAYDTANYSVAYKELRKEWMAKFFLLIPVVIGVVLHQ
jgi:tetratricopeptide (TPR) repeat protein